MSTTTETPARCFGSPSRRSQGAPSAPTGDAVTTAAAERVKALIEGRGKPTAGIRIGVRSKGCSGMSYTLELPTSRSR